MHNAEQTNIDINISSKNSSFYNLQNNIQNRWICKHRLNNNSI